jgi:phage/plasmid-associated DNA primase
MSRRPSAEIDDKELATKDGDDNKPIKAKMAHVLRNRVRIARFKGATIIEEDGVWLDMTSDRFAEAIYQTFGDGVNKSRVNDLEHLFRTTAPDMSSKAHLIAFGQGVWDTRKLDWTYDTAAEDCVYRVPYEPRGNTDKPIKFIMDLAKNKQGVYDDIMQSCAPLIMDKKPTGVIWYLGGGANGKSTLVHLLYKIFGPYLTELTVKQLEDERDTPQLNGKLGNVCKESSEGFVEDTRTYKSIGTHEGFSVHKFHSQDMVVIEGNVHHIFSANNIPTFGDKSYGARRRTLVIPFENRFKPDESFEDRVFTDEFIERFVAELVKYAKILKEQNFEYRFSDTTQLMKEKYDTDANTAQTYADELMANDLHAFLNYRLLGTDYENWCLEHGYKPSSINVLRRAIDEKGYIRKSARDENGRTFKIYAVGSVQYPQLIKVEGRLGLYQATNSEHIEVDKLGEQAQQKLLEDW